MLRPLTSSSPSESPLRSLETRSSTNWSSFDCLTPPFDDDDVDDDEDELDNEPVIMADKEQLSPSKEKKKCLLLATLWARKKNVMTKQKNL